MIKNPYTLKKGCVGFTDPGEPRVIREIAFNEGVRACIAYMDEPCTEHPYTAAFWTYRSPEGIQYYHHRRDCPKCWQSIKEGKI